jgi:peptide/nickel transport system ATP-binding protein
MNIRKIVQEPLKIHNLFTKKERDKLALDILEKVSLLPVSKYIDRYPYELSGGERQRVALARALILRPGLIVADEPTTMLDASLRLDLLKLMKSFRDDYGISYLYITHDILLAHVFCDRLLVMHKGKIVDEGNPDELISNPKHYYSNMLVDAAKAIRGANPNAV